MKKIRVLIADDVEEIRQYYKEIIDKQEDMEAVACLDSEKKTVEYIKSFPVDIALVDIQMESEYAGINATEKITEISPSTKVIILTIHSDDELITQAYIAGAVDYLIKSDDEEHIISSIRNVYNDNEFLGSAIVKNIVKNFKNVKKEQMSLLFIVTKLSTLTRTELTILKRLCMGQKREEIAQKEYIELSTVDWHIKNIRKKLGYLSVKIMIKELSKLKILDCIEKLNI